jgi:GTPase SAR1 family protein
VGDWLKEVDKHAQPEDTVRMLIGNKNDMESDRQVTPEDIKV